MSILTSSVVNSNLKTIRALTANFPEVIRRQIGNSSGFIVLKASDLRALNLKVWELNTQFSTLGENGWDRVGARVTLSGTTVNGQSVRVGKDEAGAYNFSLGGYMKIHGESAEGKARNVIPGDVLVKLSQSKELKLWVELADAPDDARIVIRLYFTTGDFKVRGADGNWEVNPDGSFVTVTRPVINIKDLWLHNLEFSGTGISSEVSDSVLTMEPEFANLL